METITLRPVTDDNREAILSLSVREDQPFVAPNDVSLRQADEENAENPGVARPFGIYADERLVGFCMFAFSPDEDDEEDRYWLWRFMIDKNEQGKGYGQAALNEIIKYFKKNGADRLYLSTEPENEMGLHVYHKAGFRETGVISDDEAVLMRMLKGPNKLIKQYIGVDVDERMRIRGKSGYGISIAVRAEDDFSTYCSGAGRFGQDFPVNPDMMFQAASVSKSAFAVTLLRFVDKGIIDLDADISCVVPEFVKKPMTFSALLSHTAGLNVHGFPGYRADHEPLSLEDVLNGKGNTPRVRRIKPYGKQHIYSGGGITLAELAFTRITGLTLREAFQKEVAEPLGLKRTGFFQPLDEEFTGSAAFGGRLGIKEDPEHGWHYYPEHAAAGLWTTPTELTKLGIALGRSYREGGLLKKETARRMFTPVLEDETYCLCVNNLRGDIGYHGGWNEGFLTEWFFSLRHDLCVASMYNRSTEYYDAQQMKMAIEIFQNIEEDLDEADKTKWEAYCGRYEQLDEDFRLSEVFADDDELYAKVIGENGEFTSKLYPIGENTYGRMGGFVKLEFGEGCVTINGKTVCRKLD